MKRFILILVLILPLSTLPSCGSDDKTDGPESKICGDFDGNGVVNEADNTALGQFLTGIGTATELARQRGDTDGDGTLANLDHLLLQQYLQGVRDLDTCPDGITDTFRP